MGSVETIAVLFSDMVGSTALASSVGPDIAEELREEHFGLLREAVAAGSGREVKNTGDGLMVAFPSAAAAVECAASMQQRIELRNRRAAHELAIRVGISIGDATPAEGDYFGSPVVEAARLCAKAAGGQVLVSDLTRMMVGRRGDHKFVAVGELELKGLPDPVAACELAWERLSAATSPLPSRLQVLPATSYVGRDEQRSLLAGLWERARRGERQMALLAGEPGIGKTRLATHTALAAHAEGGVVLYGHCDEDLNVPYQPWVEAIKHLVACASQEVLDMHIAKHGGELTRLVPELADRVASVPGLRESDPETERFLLFGAITGLLETASAEQPVVLLLDDIHWADKPSLLLLKHLVNAGAELRLMVVATYRETDIHAGHPLTVLLADLRRAQGVEWLSLEGLTPAEVAALIEAAAGHELDAAGKALANAVSRDTDGNPFFVGEILLHLVQSGGVMQGPDGRYTVSPEVAELGLPRSVRDVIGQRVGRLGEDAVRVLSVAAVIGREFDLELLGLASDRNEDDLLDLLEAAVAGSLLRESATSAGRFIFAHALINHTLYQDLSRARRARLHRRVAEALEETCGDDPADRLPELAHHWAAATQQVDVLKAISYAHRAGVRALEKLAPDEALRWFDQALEQLASVSNADYALRCDLLIGRGEAQRQVGEAGYRETLLGASEIGQRLGDANRMTRAALANYRGLWSATGVVDPERIAALRTARDALADTDPDRARVLARLAVELEWAPDFESDVRPLIDEALQIARGSNDPRVLSDVLGSVCGATQGQPQLVTERYSFVQEMQALSEAMTDPLARCMSSLWACAVALERGEIGEMDAAVDRMRAVSKEVGQPQLRSAAAFCGFTRAQIAGDLERAEALSIEFVAAATEAGNPDVMPMFGAQLGVLRLEQGRLDEIVDIYAQRAAENPGIPMLQAVLSFYYSELGRLDDARAGLDTAARDEFASLPRDTLRLMALARYGQVAVRTGANEHANTLYDLLHPYQDHLINAFVSAFGSGHLILGHLATALGRYDTADHHLAEAAQVHERIEAPLFLARTWLYHAQMLLSRGQRADLGRAPKLLQQAAAKASDHGGAAIAREARELLAQPVAT